MLQAVMSFRLKKTSGLQLIESPQWWTLNPGRDQPARTMTFYLIFLSTYPLKNHSFCIPSIFLLCNLFMGSSLRQVFQSCPSLYASFTSFWNFIPVLSLHNRLAQFEPTVHSFLITYRSHLHVVHLSLMEAPIWHHFLLRFFLSRCNISAFEQLKRESI